MPTLTKRRMASNRVGLVEKAVTVPWAERARRAGKGEGERETEGERDRDRESACV